MWLEAVFAWSKHMQHKLIVSQHIVLLSINQSFPTYGSTWISQTYLKCSLENEWFFLQKNKPNEMFFINHLTDRNDKFVSLDYVCVIITRHIRECSFLIYLVILWWPHIIFSGVFECVFRFLFPNVSKKYLQKQ